MQDSKDLRFDLKTGRKFLRDDVSNGHFLWFRVNHADLDLLVWLSITMKIIVLMKCDFRCWS